MNRIRRFFQSFPEWKIALPAILVLFLANVLIRSTRYNDFHALHSLFAYLMYLVGFGALLVSCYRAKRVVLANVVLLVVLLVVVEISLFFVLGMPFKPIGSFRTNKLKHNPKLAQMGYLPEPSRVIPEARIVNGDTLWQVDYTIDELHRRVVSNASDSAAKHALFFGCSVTYGYGVNDDQTLPYFFQQADSQYHAYNYAFNGYGTQNMLAHLQREEFEGEIAESEGFAAYVFIWHHILRSIGDMYSYSWAWRNPYYVSTENGPERKGNFADDRGLVSTFYEWVCFSSIARYFNLNFPLNITDTHLSLAADLIERSREVYKEKTGSDRFFVLIHPADTETIEPENRQRFLEMLDERNIRWLDYQELFPMDAAHKVPDDPHPNGLAHRKLAEQFARDLQEMAPAVGQ